MNSDVHIQKITLKIRMASAGCRTAVIGLLAACGSVLALPVEIPGTADHITRFYNDAELVRQSHAVADYGGCGGALIGPNLFMTAAHCGVPSDNGARNIRILLYPGGDRNAPVTDQFQCQRILDTFPDTDMLLMYCDRDGDASTDDGLGPGDIYGYLDILDEAPAAESTVHSVWTNPIFNFPSRRQQVIYSSGTVSSINVANHWANPSSVNWNSRPCNAIGTPGYTERPLVFRTSIYGEPGASGSVTLDSATGRVIGGPLSTAPSGGGTNRVSLPIAHYLDAANTIGVNDVVGPLNTPCADNSTEINEVLMQSMGLGRAGQLEGGLDKDNDGVFDAQELIERRLGENSRFVYSLFFDSERQNRLWQWRAQGSIDETRHMAIADSPGSQPVTDRVVLQHPDLNLPTSIDTLRGSIMMRKTQSPSGYMRVCLLSAGAQNCGAWKRASSDWRRHSFDLRMPGPDPVLQLMHWGRSQVEIVGLTLADTNSLLDFDTRDTRRLWKKSHGRGEALIRPDGRNENTSTPDFALVVDRDASRSDNLDQAGRYFHAGFVQGQVYEVCLQMKQDPLDPLQPWEGRGQLLLTDNQPVSEGAFITLQFRPTSDWERICTDRFIAPSDSVNIYFSTTRFTLTLGAYIVDDIEINGL